MFGGKRQREFEDALLEYQGIIVENLRVQGDILSRLLVLVDGMAQQMHKEGRAVELKLITANRAENHAEGRASDTR